MKQSYATTGAVSLPNPPFEPFGPMVLAIEDEDDHFALLELQLGEERPAVRMKRAGSLAAARELSQGDRFDAMLLDLDLPDSQGLNTLSAAKLMFPALPLIVLSSHSDVDFALDAVQNGAADYIDKSSLSTAGLGQRIAFAIERAEAQRELRRRSEMLRTMIAILGHDLKGPQRQIRVLCGMIETELEPEARKAVSRHLDAIRGRCSHLKTLLDETTAYAVNAAKEPEKTLHYLSEVIERVRADLDPDGRRRLSLVQDAQVFADPGLMFHILQNVIGNGLTYWRGTPSKVSVRASNMGNETKIIVSDTGMGVPAGMLTRIFQPNIRAVDASEFPGTGFGLSIVRLLVEAHGGSVNLASKPGRGTTATLTLPYLNTV